MEIRNLSSKLHTASKLAHQVRSYEQNQQM